MSPDQPPVDALEVFRHRGGLRRALRKLDQGRLTVGFIGGSITDARSGHNWPGPVVAWLVETFPQARIVVENAAIGATGSDLAVFRAQRDLIDRGCDLVFIEYAVNDNGTPTAQRSRTREGLIRKLLADGPRDLVLTYTFSQPMYEDMMAGRVPDSVAEFEALGEHYGIGSVWMGLWALNEVRRGRMRWEVWLPDGLHPQHRGSESYAQSVIALLEKELLRRPDADEIPAGDAMGPPLDPTHWGGAYGLSFAEVETEGPWAIHRWPCNEWIDQVLATTAPGARLRFAFTGRALSLGFDFGKASSDFRYRIDGGEWVTECRPRPDWCGAEGWFRISHLADELPAGEHSVEIEVLHGGPDCGGTNFRLGLIGVVP